MKKRAILTLVVIIIAAITTFLCRRVESPANLLLITLDTTRADHLGCYGYTNALTPALDSLAKNGVLFEQAYTPAPITLPAHTTMLTGLYPPEHGIRNNGKNSLNPQIPLLPEILSKRGYQTAAFIASTILDSKFGLSRGFDMYDDKSTAPANTSLSAITANDDNLINYYRPATEITDAAIQWFSSMKKKHPFFCWVHFYDPHNPRYDHKDIFGNKFNSDYDAEIAFMDQQISRLLTFLQEKNLLQNTVIVAVGDHGESLGEHGENTHGLTVYNCVMRVPLIIAFPEKIKAGHRVTTTLPMTDLFPTILSMLSVNPQIYPKDDPRNLSLQTAIQRNVMTALAGKEIEPRPWYGETYGTWENFRWSPLQCYFTAEWKYILTAKPELYNRVTDPGETNNIINSHSDISSNMQNSLTAFLKNIQPPLESSSIKLSAEERRSLESLGYTAGGQSVAPPSSIHNLPDIKDMLPLVPLYWYICAQIEKPDLSPDLINMCDILVTNSPGTPRFQTHKGSVLMQRGMKAEAEACFKQALAIDPQAVRAHNNLALLLLERNDIESAIQHLSEVIRIDPSQQISARNLAVAHNQLGISLGQAGNMTSAMEHFQTAIKINPASAPSYLNLGAAFMYQNNFKDAVLQFQEALKIDPSYAQASQNLALAQQKLKENSAGK